MPLTTRRSSGAARAVVGRPRGDEDRSRWRARQPVPSLSAGACRTALAGGRGARRPVAARAWRWDGASVARNARRRQGTSCRGETSSRCAGAEGTPRRRLAGVAALQPSPATWTARTVCSGRSGGLPEALVGSPERPDLANVFLQIFELNLKRFEYESWRLRCETQFS